jgi:ribosomal protein S18 acetylase RimI-like enzyme
MVPPLDQPTLFSVRPGAASDADGIAAILRSIAAEGDYTAITEPWPVEAQQRYIEHLSPRAAVHVASATGGALIGYQTLDLWAPTIASMAHVGQMGTFISRQWRRRGVGQALFGTTSAFARRNGYAKLVIQVRASNGGAQAFYRRMGFLECGRLSRQVRIGGVEDDELLMELFL